MAVVFERPHALTDKVFSYCPGCPHGIVHRLVAETIDELGIDNYGKKSFVDDLLLFASNWIGELAVPIMRRADELYDDPAIRYIVHEYAEARRDHDTRQSFVLHRIAEGSEMYDERDYDDELLSGKMNMYSDVLYEMLG